MSDFNVWSYFAKLGVQVRVPNDPYFEEGDNLCKICEPVVLTVEDVEEFLHKDFDEFLCQIPGCRASFNQLFESEAHYNSVHKHSCSVCKKSLPSYHLLELHIQENHDSFFSILSEKKPSFQCFLPTCSLKFWNGDERRDHAISDHSFPPDFRFDQGKRKPRKKSAKTKDDRPCEPTPARKTVEERSGVEEVVEVAERVDQEMEEVVTTLRDKGKSKRGSRLRGSRKEMSPTKILVGEDDADMGEEHITVDVNGTWKAGDKVGIEQNETRKVGTRVKTEENGTQKVGTRVETEEKGTQKARPRAETEENGGQMEVDGEQVILRRPISLARMGERRSVYVESIQSPPPLPSPSSILNPPLPSTPSHAEEPLDNDAHEMASDCPAAYVPASQHVSRKSSSQGVGLSRLGRPESGSQNRAGSVVASPRIDLGSDSPVSSPRKSKIPVRSNSCRAPKNFSFGAGVPKGFQRPKSKHWYQSTQSIHTASDRQSTDMSQLLNSLPTT